MTTYDKNDPATIQEMFNSIAENYDRTNSILSFQMHKRWNQTLIQKTLLQTHPKSILDLCCGTGDIAFEYLKHIKTKSQCALPKVYMLDFSVEMLACARKKAETEKLDQYDISYLQADAQFIPITDHCIDCATIAYGIRNVKQPQQCLKDVYRVLKKGGIFGILELTQPKNPILRLGHGVYLRNFLPVLGKLVTSNPNAYRYLSDSIHSFMQPQALISLMQTTGFRNIVTIPLLGGIATILIGKKSES